MRSLNHTLVSVCRPTLFTSWLLGLLIGFFVLPIHANSPDTECSSWKTDINFSFPAPDRPLDSSNEKGQPRLQACIRTVVAIHRSEMDLNHKDLLSQEIRNTVGTPSYDPVTKDDSNCGDQILGKELLNDPNTSLLLVDELDSILNVPFSWNDPNYVYFTGVPEWSGTPDTLRLIKVEDAVIKYVSDEQFNNPCGAILNQASTSDNQPAKEIIRKFVYKDESGQEHKVFQSIHFFEPVRNKPEDDCKANLDQDLDYQYCIKFPKDKVVTCMSEAQEQLAIEDSGCDLFSVSIEENQVESLDFGTCSKVQRIYRLINWCQAGVGFYPEASLFKLDDLGVDLTPMVIGRDMDCNGIVGDSDVFLHFAGRVNLDRGGVKGTTWIDLDCSATNGYPKADIACSNPEGYLQANNYNQGFYQYTQVIQLSDKSAPTIESISQSRFPIVSPRERDLEQTNSCQALVEQLVSIQDECNDRMSIDQVAFISNHNLGLGKLVLFQRDQVTSEGLGYHFDLELEGFSAQLRGLFPLGKHKFELSISDPCGNSRIQALNFEVYDEQPPVPICQGAISANVLPVDENADGILDAGRGAIDVWATDLLASFTSDCSAPLRYSIHRADRINNDLEEPNPQQKSIRLTCQDPLVNVVYIYAWDGAGNVERCESLILLTDQFGLCSATAEPKTSIAGTIYTEQNQVVEAVELNLTGDLVVAGQTQVDGTYQFNNLDIQQNYTIAPVKDDDPTNGVSTFDLILLSQHILGVKSLDGPYQMIAADVNNSGSVTTLDMIHLRNLILRVDRHFPSNTSWRFILENYKFPDPQNPWQERFKEVFTLRNSAATKYSADFIGVKIGDINGSAIANQQGVIKERLGSRPLLLTMANQVFKAGEEYRVPIFADALDQILGLQGTMSWSTDQIEVKAITAGLIPTNGLSLKPLEGMITFSHIVEERTREKALFHLRIKAKKTCSLKDALSLSSKLTEAEAYFGEIEGRTVSRPLALQFQDVHSLTEHYELRQNYPNPFRETTQIGFSIPESSMVELSIHNVLGRKLKIYKGQYSKGYHEIRLDMESLGYPKGLLFYTLKAKDYRQTRQMSTVQ